VQEFGDLGNLPVNGQGLQILTGPGLDAVAFYDIQVE
jgi:hypothetical protein